MKVFFKNFKDDIWTNVDLKEKVLIIESASYLTIDQFNDYGQKDLEKLRKYGIKGLPKSINEIKFNASGTTHRSHTHRGWDYNYFGVTKDLWPVRKQILINTVGEVFDFKGDSLKQESFCKLIYYVHILCDHMDDTSYKVTNGLKIDVGGRVDQYDIIHELMTTFETLFKDQKNTHKYRRIGKLVRSEGGINSDDKFSEFKDHTTNLFDVLTMYLPEMLKEEEFFSAVFYK